MREDILRYKLTYALIALNVGAYFLSSILSHNFIDMDTETLVNLGALYGPYTVMQAEWWRLLTAMFLHGGMTHLLMNMFSLYLVGRGVEMYFDTKSYVSIYLFSGLIGGLCSIYMHPDGVAIGASGAIFGIFGALAGFFLAYRDKIVSHTKAFMKDFSIIIGLNLVIGLSIESVDVSAHIGGLFVGLMGGFLIAKNSRFLMLFNSAMILTIVVFAFYLSGQYVQAFF